MHNQGYNHQQAVQATIKEVAEELTKASVPLQML